jgi:hypothetical protein
VTASCFVTPNPAARSSIPRSALLSDIATSPCVPPPLGERIAAAGIAVPIQATIPITAADVRLGVSSAEKVARKRRCKKGGRKFILFRFRREPAAIT